MARKATQQVQSSGRGPMPLGAFAFMAVACIAVIGRCTAPDSADAQEAAAQAVVRYMEYNNNQYNSNQALHDSRLKIAREAAGKYVFVDTGVFGGGDVMVHSSYWGKPEYAGPVSNSKLYMTFSQNGW